MAGSDITPNADPGRRALLRGLLGGAAAVGSSALLSACGGSSGGTAGASSTGSSSATARPPANSTAVSTAATSSGSGAASSAVGSSVGAAAPGGGAIADLSDQFSWLKLEPFNGYFVADAKGYFAQQRIQAKLNAGGPNISASQVVVGGRADLGDEDNITLLQAQAKGLPLIAFATVFQKSPYSCISTADKPIRTLQDFAGKTIAIASTPPAVHSSNPP